MRLLLLGENGQVGRELQRSLAPLGEVVACDRAEIDLEDLLNLQSAICQIEPDAIINAAAYTSVDRAEEEPDIARVVNTDAVGILAHQAKLLDIPLVHYSTDYVFDGAKQEPYVEDDDTNPLSVYGSTKLAGEEAIRASGCKHLIFRTSWVYGLHGSNFPKTMLRLAQERDELKVVRDQHGVPTSAVLIADITAECFEKSLQKEYTIEQTAGTYHLTPTGKTNWYEIAKYVLAEAQNHGETLRTTPDMVQPVSTSEFPTATMRPANSLLNTEKLTSTFDVHLPHWKHHLQSLVSELVRRVAT